MHGPGKRYHTEPQKRYVSSKRILQLIMSIKVSIFLNVCFYIMYLLLIIINIYYYYFFIFGEGGGQIIQMAAKNLIFFFHFWGGGGVVCKNVL